MSPSLLPPEALLAAAYAFLLLLAAAGLEWMGRHSHRRAGQFHARGFRFDRDADHWECPEGMRLQRAEIDNALRVIRYRAPAHTCNSCAVKSRCTDSDTGREIEVSLDPWLASATGRFHRGISLVLVVLSGSILAVELLRLNQGAGRWMLSAALAGVSLLAIRLARKLVNQPDDRP